MSPVRTLVAPSEVRKVSARRGASSEPMVFEPCRRRSTSRAVIVGREAATCARVGGVGGVVVRLAIAAAVGGADAGQGAGEPSYAAMAAQEHNSDEKRATSARVMARKLVQPM